MLTDNLPLGARVHKKEMHTIMKITLRERTAETTAIYFRKASTPQIRRTLPQKAKTLAEALEDFEATRLFLLEIIPKYDLHTIGAFTYADNLPSVKVLEKIILPWWKRLWKTAFPQNIMSSAVPCRPA